MNLAELNQFLDQGERGVKGKETAPADAALVRGDELAGRGRPIEAAASYGEALRTAPPAWPARIHAVRELAWSLLHGRESQPCAETALAEAPGMPRESPFASVVLAGFTCANMGGSEAWAESARAKLEPLAVEAVGLPATLRDDRFELYQRLMHAAQMRDDNAAVTRWGERWLDEIEKATPSGDDERSALDIARVDAVGYIDQPARVLPALEASERAMPDNYNASLRLAQMETAAKRYDDALAACDRGLAHVTGPIGRSWLLRTKAEALDGKGETAKSRAAFEEALKAAKEIGARQLRDSNVSRITQEIAEIDRKAP
jgi:predicted negative regulator of RcsB-dependent stress response